jgi:hypothetical protein
VPVTATAQSCVQRGVPVVSVGWLDDSVAAGTLRPLDAYRLKPLTGFVITVSGVVTTEGACLTARRCTAPLHTSS